MKVVKNKYTKTCACSSIPNIYTKNKRRRRKTEEDWDRIDTFNERLEKFCVVNKHGHCEEEGMAGHSTIGIRSMGQCRYCKSRIWEFINHVPLPNYSVRQETVSGRAANILGYLPIPQIRVPSPDDIQEDNQMIEDESIDEWEL